MPGRSDRYIRILVISALILCGLTVSLLAQDKQISGKINVYRQVIAIGPGSDNVTLNSVDSIAQGDTVLLIQMQGVGFATDAVPYGTAIQTKIGEPGGYEFLLVESVDPGTKIVVFMNDIMNTFDIKGNVQLIKVPFYNSATVTGKLTAKSWDNIDKTGGVLAMIVGRKLSLKAEIDVSSKGFSGGKDSEGIGECVYTDYSSNSNDAYPESWLNAGYKGEGVAIHDKFGILLAPLRVKGMGVNFTGGGGGNGKYSGGGGGSNRGFGGDGTTEKFLNGSNGGCATPFDGAFGGTTIKGTIISDGIFFGGGGGASTHAAGSSGSSGGNGGGIIIIIADTISGNSNTIKADGAISANAGLEGGAGGGGAGGSIILSVQSFSVDPSDALTLSVRGGDGGISQGGFGNGGGGSGGLVWVNATGASEIPAKVPVRYDYGVPGQPLDQGNGELKFSFKPKLNGFLFNSIRSEITGNQVDSICSNVSFGKITGTLPVGGVAPHTFLWQSTTISDVTGWGPALGTNNLQDYSPGLLTQTTWFRRTVTDNVGMSDVSKAVKIIAQSFIKNNIVGNPDTICFAMNPPAFSSKAILTDGNGKYTFKWESSTDNSLFNLPSNVYNTEGYTPVPALKATSWYRRTVTSGRCVDSTAIVKITVLDTISNNRILTIPQEICFGMNFTDLSATTTSTTPALAGGDNSYRFKWESNINGSGWGNAAGINTGTGYNPAELPQKTPMNEYYFRRVVSSGIHNACVDVSKPVLLKDFPVLTNNSIDADQTICSGSIPVKIAGSQPLNGNGIYTYTWQDSTKAHLWTDIPGAINITDADHQPPALIDSTSYRRIVLSSACTNASNSIIVNVHKPVTNNIVSLVSGGLTDTTICSGQIPHKLIGTSAAGGMGTYSYQWLDSATSRDYGPVAGTGTGVNYNTLGNLTETTFYKRKVISGACTVISNSTITINVLPLIANNIISADQTICDNTAPVLLTGETLSGGSGIYLFLWQDSTQASGWKDIDLATSETYQPSVLNSPANYKRIVYSGSHNCCMNISNTIKIGINPLPVNPYPGPDTAIYSIEKIYHMKASKPASGETGYWAVLDPQTSTIDDLDISNNLALVKNLSAGKNYFLWTVFRGPCKLEDSIYVELLNDLIPEGFSPNSDEWNNEFIIEGLNLEDHYVDLSVVNGAGAEIFSTTNRNGQLYTNWNGKNSRGFDLPEGTYYYMLKITTKDNKLISRKSGFIVLKRY